MPQTETTQHLIVGEVPAQPSLPVPADWFTALDELMAVVESLCPRYPERPITMRNDDMRL